jgi:hypothetical protein
MAMTTFDTLKFANALKAAGVPDKQAEAEATILSEFLQVNVKELATKQDLQLVRQEVEQLGKDLRSEMQQQGKDLRSEMALLQSKTSQDISSLDAKLEKNNAQIRGEQVLIRWMVGFGLAGMVAILIRLFVMKAPI